MVIHCRWKRETSRKIIQLEAAVNEVLHKTQLPGLATFSGDDESHPPWDREPNPEEDVGIAEDKDRGNQAEPLQKQNFNAVPMRTLMEVTSPQSTPETSRTAQDVGREDLISSGQLPLSLAHDFFNLFKTRMNQYLWGGVAFPHDSLETVRQSSSLMSTVIFTIAALHVHGQEELFDVCYKEYVSLIARTMIGHDHNLDDIRALVLGAFWLPDLSWKLSGLAVRMATELNLHQAFHQLLLEEEDKFARSRLWYLLFVCDRHFSIAYGRPPMLNGNYTITNYKRFLDSPLSTPADCRLISQVDLFKTLDEAYHKFGADTALPLEEAEFDTLRKFTVKVENWRVEWQPRLGWSSSSFSY